MMLDQVVEPGYPDGFVPVAKHEESNDTSNARWIQILYTLKCLHQSVGSVVSCLGKHDTPHVISRHRLYDAIGFTR